MSRHYNIVLNYMITLFFYMTAASFTAQKGPALVMYWCFVVKEAVVSRTSGSFVA